jgi:hypothetical protein
MSRKVKEQAVDAVEEFSETVNEMVDSVSDEASDLLVSLQRALTTRKEDHHVMDNCFDTDRSVVIGAGEQLHIGRVHSHPVGDCHYCFDSRNNQWP